MKKGRMDSHILGYPRIWECIPIYWGAPVCRNAFLYARVPKYVGMHSHTLGYPSIWKSIRSDISMIKSDSNSVAYYIVVPAVAHTRPFKLQHGVWGIKLWPPRVSHERAGLNTTQCPCNYACNTPATLTIYQ